MEYTIWDKTSPINGVAAEEILSRHQLDPNTCGTIFLGTEGGKVNIFQYDKINIYTPDDLEKVKKMYGYNNEKTWEYYKRCTQEMLDNFAKERDFDSIDEACTYISSSNPTWKMQAEYCVKVRDEVWAQFEKLSAFEPPETFDTLKVKLPAMEWPFYAELQ